MGKFRDLTGIKVNQLTGISRSHTDKHGKAHWVFICSCGKKITTAATDVRKGHTKSCGCYKSQRNRERFTSHNMTYSPEFLAWVNMRNRCDSDNPVVNKHYGARGIKYTKRWVKFENFYKDMGPRPGKGYSVDRIDVNKGYSKANCRWATQKTQTRNRRKTIFLTFNGVKKPLAEWAEQLSIPYGTVYSRYRNGWKTEQVLKAFKEKQK